MSEQEMREALLQVTFTVELAERERDETRKAALFRVAENLARVALSTPPAAPVVPEEMQHQPMRADESRSDQLEAYAYVNGWNACRRAMLAAAPAPSQDNEGAA